MLNNENYVYAGFHLGQKLGCSFVKQTSPYPALYLVHSALKVIRFYELCEK